MQDNIGRRIYIIDLGVFGTVVEENDLSFIIKGKDDAEYQRLTASRNWHFISEHEFDTESVR